MPLHHVVNLSLLVLWPIAWAAPLAHAGLLPWFGGREISVLSGVADLWDVDRALAILVAVFAIVVPYAKTLGLAAVHRGLAGERTARAVELVGKLSMADVFLIALYIVVAKGVGLGHVEPGWGLWLFTALVLAQIGVGIAGGRRAWAS